MIKLHEDRVERQFKFPKISKLKPKVECELKYEFKTFPNFPKLKPQAKQKSENLIQLKIKQKKYEEMIKSKEKITEKVQNITEKIKIIVHLQKKYGIKFNNKEIKNLSIKGLCKRAKYLKEINDKVKSCFLISSWWKRIIIKSKIQKEYDLMNNSVKLIQDAWKKYKLKKNREEKCKSQLKLMALSAIKIQKVFRGFLVRREYSLLLEKQKFNRFLSELENIRKSIFEKFMQTIQIAALKRYFKIIFDHTNEKGMRKNAIGFRFKRKLLENKSIYKYISHQNLVLFYTVSEPSSPFINSSLNSLIESRKNSILSM